LDAHEFRGAMEEVFRRFGELAPASDAPTLGEALARWLARPQIQPQTLRGYRYAAAHLEPLADKPVDRIAPADVDNLVAAIRDRSPAYRRTIAQMARAVVRHEAARRGAKGWPLLDYKPPPGPSKGAPVPPEPQVSDWLDGCKPGLRRIAEFLRDVGCRQNEARRLEARHLDRPNGCAWFDEHKTAAGGRHKLRVFIPPRWWPALEDLARERPEGPLFVNERGRPWDGRHLSRMLSRAARRSGVATKGHGLRRRWITRRLAEGHALLLVSRAVGHRSIRTTERYIQADAVDPEVAEMVRKLA
jgi:integrase